MSKDLDTRVAQAVEVVKTYGLQKEFSDDRLKRKIKEVLKSKTEVLDESLREQTCLLVYTEILKDLDMATDLLIASTRFGKDNQVSVNVATVRLIREMVYAISGSI